MRYLPRLFSLALIFSSLTVACGGAAPSAAPDAVSLAGPDFTEPAVMLLAPLPEAEWQGASLMLEWSWYRELKDNERFDVRVWRDGEPAYGIAWVQVNYLNLANWLLTAGDGQYYRSYAVDSWRYGLAK